MQNVSDIDTAHVRGIAQMYQGAMLLSRSKLQDAIEFFSNSQRLFHDASTLHSEAVAWLALGIAYQRQYQQGIVSEEHHWAKTLKALQCSLAILLKLEDKLQVDVRDRLAEVQELLQRDLATRRFSPYSKSPPRPSTAQKGKTIPIFARIAAGQPIWAEKNIQDHLLLDNKIAAQVDFALQVEGDSMIGIGITEGDLVLIEKRNDSPPDRKIVAIIVSQQSNEATLKRFFTENDHIRLEPENDSYPLIIITPESDPLKVKSLRDRYAKSHPKRLIEIYSGEEPQIAGWARALIRQNIL